MDFSETMAVAAHVAASAVHETMRQHRLGHIVDEDDITPDLLATLRTRVNGPIGGLTWTSSVVRHRRGIAAEEATIGADMVICVRLDTSTEKYAKGVLVQAKRVGPGAVLSKSQLNNLKEQCNRMLTISPSSFVFDYSPYGMRVGAASRIAGTAEVDMSAICGWTPYRFFLELFRCPVGDPRLKSSLVSDLPLPQLHISAEGSFEERG